MDRADVALLGDPAASPFHLRDLLELPDPVVRHLRSAIAVGTPAAPAARLRMAGRLRLGRWLPFRAEEVLAPSRGFVWRARVAGVIRGSDAYIDGEGAMSWRLGGVVPVMQANGPDVTRSARDRAVAEAMWVPTALLPSHGATWRAAGETELVVTLSIDGHQRSMTYWVERDGRISTFEMQRWGDPDRTGTWGLHPFGGEVTGYGTLDGLTVPTCGRVGWYPGDRRRGGVSSSSSPCSRSRSGVESEVLGVMDQRPWCAVATSRCIEA